MEWKGDFLGFTFAGVHSSALNIVRTSDGDRFEEQILPEVKDISVEVPGMDGEYYFGSTYGPRTHEISIAYDSITEEQFRQIRKLYGQKRQGELIFDERPYKKYIAKIESPIELSYICFDEPKYNWDKIQTGYNQYVKGIQGRDFEFKNYDGTTQRIYKGEGNITFVSYFPFAKSCFKVLPEAGNDYYEGRDNWAVSSGILSQTERNDRSIDTYIQETNKINVYNAGDVATGFRLYLPAAATNTITITYNAGISNNNDSASLIIKPFTLKRGDSGCLIDTNTGLIVGVSSMTIDQNGNPVYTTTGNLYNEYIDGGYFFKLQPNLKTDEAQIEIIGIAGTPQIFYDYLYF